MAVGAFLYAVATGVWIVNALDRLERDHTSAALCAIAALCTGVLAWL